MLLLASICWGFRVLFIVLVPAHRLPRVASRALGHLGPSVLAALVAVETESAARSGSAAEAAYVVAAVFSMALVARCTRSLLWTMAAATVAVVLLDVVLV
jgi:branched-subunit amino acid transport protein